MQCMNGFYVLMNSYFIMTCKVCSESENLTIAELVLIWCLLLHQKLSLHRFDTVIENTLDTTKESRGKPYIKC